MGIFESVKNYVDFGVTSTGSDVTITANKWVEVASRTVGAQTEEYFGVGVVTPNGTDSRETCTIKLYDNNGAQITKGKLRLRVTDANENRAVTVAEDLLSAWSSGKKLGVFPQGAGEDSKLKVEVNLLANTTFDVSNANNSASIPVTVKTRY